LIIEEPGAAADGGSARIVEAGASGPKERDLTQSSQSLEQEGTEKRMRTVVAAVIEGEDRRLLIGQRRKTDSSPLKWEFPGGKVREGEAPEAALARELREELGVTLT